MVFATIAFVLAAFLTLYGIIFFTLGNKATGKLFGIMPMKALFFIFGFLYVAIAHFSIVSAVAYGVDVSELSPCENVVSNSTVVSTTVVAYEYHDSCRDREAPKSTERLYKVLLTIMYIEALALLIGFLGFIGELLGKW